MKAIRVQYTVREGFEETNEANIRAVMAELREKGDVGVRYTAFRVAGGRTFTHVVVLRDDDARSLLPSLESFKRFQAALRENVETPPAAEDWVVVDTSHDL